MTAAGLSYRPARPDDVPALEALIAEVHLPNRLIAEFIDGFVVAETDGEIVACGGVEVYGSAAVLRSIAVRAAFQARGAGRRIVEMLTAHAGRAGVTDLYLFTVDAAPFWQRLGFTDVSLDDWRPEARACWQYRYVASHLEEFRRMGLRSMWRALPSEAVPS